MSTDYLAVNGLLEMLVEHGSIPRSTFDDLELDPTRLGLVVHDQEVTLAPDTQVLEHRRIGQGLSATTTTWLRDLKIWRGVDSTNKRLMELAEQSSIDGVVHVAELQIQGRGRRGRHWYSPFAGNLAVSMGISIALEPADLGGLSLATGLAGVDCFARSGLQIDLKWPNDLQVGGAKLGGILIEVLRRPGGVEAVIGIGVNVAVPAHVRQAIDQPIVDLASLGITTGRSDLVAHLIDAVYRRVRRFEQHGFAGMMQEFDDRHAFHQRACRLSQGDVQFHGTVLGVSPGGELRLGNAAGERLYGAGEVSLRRS